MLDVTTNLREPLAQSLREVGEVCVSTCAHCGQRTAGRGRFCCLGCKAVYGLLHRRGLAERFYELRGAEGLPATAITDGRFDWLQVARSSGGNVLSATIRGIHCGACVWLIESLYKEHGGKAGLYLAPGSGSVRVRLTPGFDVEGWFRDIERFGYSTGPAVAGSGDERASDLLVRTGICVALSMNVMLLSAARYVGLDSHSGLGTLFHDVGFAMCVAATVIGGSVFMKPAWEAIRRRTPTLDIPIALGLALAFGSTSWGYFSHGQGAFYSDTVTVFVTLMVLGRYLQERVLSSNRRRVQADLSAGSLLVRRVESTGPRLVRADTLTEGDTLLLGAGDLCPVRARAESGATINMEWINGESEPARIEAGSEIPAGGFVANGRATLAVALERLEASTLAELLRSPLRGDNLSEQGSASPYRGFIPLWILFVVTAGAAGAVGHGALYGTARGLEVLTSILVATCPCAIGLALPIAHDWALLQLRQQGVFVRTARFLEALLSVQTIAFDKTGTLTEGLSAQALTPLDAVDPAALAALRFMASSSSHPVAQAILAAVPEGPLVMAANAEEREGEGMMLTVGASEYRLGKPAFAAPAPSAHVGLPADVVFSRDGNVLASFSLRERLRPEARSEMQALRQAGFRVVLLSGDRRARVDECARALGLPSIDAHAEQTPANKRAWVEAQTAPVFFVGDGVNDVPAAAAAHCSATPAVDRPFLPARTDMFFTSRGLGAVRSALVMAARLKTVARVLFGVALAYNVVILGTALAGHLSPLLAAVAMPISSIGVVLLARIMLREPRAGAA